jgi:hypothetical protein
MATLLTTTDLDVLRRMSDYQVLSIAQLASLYKISRQMAGRRAKGLARSGLVTLVLRNFAGAVGRPETVISLTKEGVQALEGASSNSGKRSWPEPQNIDPARLEHHLLLNWLRLHLVQMERQRSELRVNYLSSVEGNENKITSGGTEGAESIIPDGIYSITSPEQQKSLLFFVEVDMGTESLAGASRQSIGAKVDAYQAVFAASSYKKFESILNGPFLGFRVLFLANSQPRLKHLCRLIASIKDTEFIWLSDQDSMFAEGIAGRIWIKGGRTGDGLFSILGPTLAFKSPIE